MAHKFYNRLVDKELWTESQVAAQNAVSGLTPSTKSWFTKIILGTIVISIICFIYVTLFPWFLIKLIYVLPITLSVFIVHEALHFITATLLGYKTDWYPVNMVRIPYTKHFIQMEGFDVIFPNQAAADKHKRIIGIAPYLFVFPLSLIFLLTGILHLQVSGTILIITHLFSILFEGIQE